MTLKNHCEPIGQVLRIPTGRNELFLPVPDQPYVVQGSPYVKPYTIGHLRPGYKVINAGEKRRFLKNVMVDLRKKTFFKISSQCGRTLLKFQF